MMNQLVHGIFAVDASDLDVRSVSGGTAQCLCPLCLCRGRAAEPTLRVNIADATGHCRRCGAGFVVRGTDYDIPKDIEGVLSVREIIEHNPLNIRLKRKKGNAV